MQTFLPIYSNKKCHLPSNFRTKCSVQHTLQSFAAAWKDEIILRTSHFSSEIKA